MLYFFEVVYAFTSSITPDHLGGMRPAYFAAGHQYLLAGGFALCMAAQCSGRNVVLQLICPCAPEWA